MVKGMVKGTVFDCPFHSSKGMNEEGRKRSRMRNRRKTKDGKNKDTN